MIMTAGLRRKHTARIWQQKFAKKLHNVLDIICKYIYIHQANKIRGYYWIVDPIPKNIQGGMYE